MNRKDVKLHQVIGKGEFGGKWFTVCTAATHSTAMQTLLHETKQNKNKNINDSVSLLRVVNENLAMIKKDNFLSDDCRCDGGGLQRDQSGRKVH